jgi:ADP-ribose pyrophosphatase YjhB (NUDIX family)
MRCQGAVVRGESILLLKHVNHRSGRVYWWLPGGGLEPGETLEACVEREVSEETCLEVQVERLLFESEDPAGRYTYTKYATYLCLPVSGKPAIGTERESSAIHSIVDIGWYPLWDESRWEADFFEPHLYPILKAIQESLGG